MSRPTRDPRGASPRGSQRGHLTDHGEVYKVGALARQRARRDLAELRAILDDHDRGLIDLEEAAWQIDRLGASLGAKAARGLLRVAA